MILHNPGPHKFVAEDNESVRDRLEMPMVDNHVRAFGRHEKRLEMANNLNSMEKGSPMDGFQAGFITSHEGDIVSATLSKKKTS